MTSLERTAAEILAFLLLVGGFALYERHKGAAACKQADVVQIQKQEVHAAAVVATDAQIINTEAKTYAQSVAAAPDPTPALVCVRQYAAPRPVSEAATARPRNDGPTDLPKADSPGFDPGPKLAPIGIEADARVAYLQDYIRNVCSVR